jgi:hypothetical protein
MAKADLCVGFEVLNLFFSYEPLLFYVPCTASIKFTVDAKKLKLRESSLLGYLKGELIYLKWVKNDIVAAAYTL